jgi:hypothetical protein
MQVYVCLETTAMKINYHIFRPITRALSIQKRCKIVKNEHARYTLERFPTDNARVICTKKGIGKYGIMYYELVEKRTLKLFLFINLNTQVG